MQPGMAMTVKEMGAGEFYPFIGPFLISVGPHRTRAYPLPCFAAC